MCTDIASSSLKYSSYNSIHLCSDVYNNDNHLLGHESGFELWKEKALNFMASWQHILCTLNLFTISSGLALKVYTNLKNKK